MSVTIAWQIRELERCFYSLMRLVETPDAPSDDGEVSATASVVHTSDSGKKDGGIP
jgi:hypothetical protein